MFSATIFNIGPYQICFWNIILLSIIFLIAVISRRVIHRLLKRYLKNANIILEGRRVTWLKLFSQSVYLLALYIGILSLKFNNPYVTFSDFLNFNILKFTKFKLNFYHCLILISIFYGAKIMSNVVKLYISRKYRENSQYDRGSEYVYNQIAKYIIYIFSILMSFQVLEIDLTILLTGSAALLVGLGLGLQDVFKDMIAGIVLLFEGNVKVGDIVEISSTGKSSGIIAKILRINVRTTQIETREGNVIIIPNTRLTQDNVENWSHGSELSRFTILVTVNYGSNSELVTRLLKQAALAHPKVKKNQPVLVRLSNFSDNGLEMELIFWADQSWDINNYKSEIRMEIDRLFREYKITIPYPQRVIHQGNNII
ncbi:MAG: mechanosensitive ion channel [Bacteroidetes bacterium]|nr:mechanosensitive ion channel [Bacteroidota bacterium]